MKKKGWYWPYALCGLLAIPVVFDSILIYSALTDPSFAVEEDYYEKALAWDEYREQQNSNHRLGWSLEVSFGSDSETSHTRVLGERRVQLSLRDSEGRALTDAVIDATAFHHARAANRVLLSFTPKNDGYEAWVPRPREGRWQFRFVVRRGDQVFTSQQDLELET